MKITIFKNITETKNPYYISIDSIVQRIKDGNSRSLVNKIRGQWTKDARNDFKRQLPSICFSGIFEKRANNSIKEHTGLVCLDFDHLEDVEKFKEQMKEDAYTMIAFVSPSGDGVKVIVKIPANIETHEASCRALAKYHTEHNLDDFKDVARVCFESYDKNIYYNPESSIFNELIHEEIKKVERKSVNNDTSDVFNKLKTWIEKGVEYTDGNKHSFIVKFAGALNRFGVNQYEAENLLINEYQYKASYVKHEDFSSIVNKVYASYQHQNSISYFENTGIAYEKHTRKEIAKDFINEYVPEKLDENDLKKELAEAFNDPDINIDEPPAIVSIRNINSMKYAPIMTAGNISVIKGRAKSKKTYFLSLVCSSMVSNAENHKNIIPSLQKDQKQVLLFDTEQSKFHSSRLAKRIIKMSKCDAEHFGSFSLRGKDGSKIIKLIDYACNFYKHVGAIIIDQIADTVTSMNEEKEAVNVVRFLERISDEKNIHVCVVVHENKANNYAQGWLGTQLMKKAETVIEVQKNDMFPNVSKVIPNLSRDIEFEEFSFKINDFGYPEIIESTEHDELYNDNEI